MFNYLWMEWDGDSQQQPSQPLFPNDSQWQDSGKLSASLSKAGVGSTRWNKSGPADITIQQRSSP